MILDSDEMQITAKKDYEKPLICTSFPPCHKMAYEHQFNDLIVSSGGSVNEERAADITQSF